MHIRAHTGSVDIGTRVSAAQVPRLVPLGAEDGAAIATGSRVAFAGGGEAGGAGVYLHGMVVGHGSAQEGTAGKLLLPGAQPKRFEICYTCCAGGKQCK